MKWRSKTYNIKLSDGTQSLCSGISNGLCALNAAGELTHLKSGLRIVHLKTEDAGKIAGDYLAEKYADDFASLNKSVERDATFQEIIGLPEKEALETKLKTDVFFQSLLEQHGYKPEQEDEDE